MFTIVSTRFTNLTLKENIDYRNKYNYECIYGSPQEFSPKILYDSIVFVVEMNNESNTIEGIGLIKNRPYLDKYYKIYNDGNYNRYIYKSKYFINRETIIRYNELLVKALDYILFKEKSHLKRGTGFTTVSDKLLYNKFHEKIDIKYEIKNIFLLIFSNICICIENNTDDKVFKE
jgi:hypothetical protein